MAKKSDSTAAAKPKQVVVLLGAAEPDTLRPFGGSKSDRFNNALIDSMVNTGWFPTGMSDEDRARLLFVAVTGLMAFKPTDEIEGMLAAQATSQLSFWRFFRTPRSFVALSLSDWFI